MIWIALLLPVISGLCCFGIRSSELRRLLVCSTAGFHLLSVLFLWGERNSALGSDDWIGLDPLGYLFLLIVSLLFLCASLYAMDYLARDTPVARVDAAGHLVLRSSPEQIFSGCLLLFLAAMTLATVSRHFVLIWLAVELTTVVSAPLIYFHRTQRSLEAMWKYLLTCSVGISLALLGTSMLAASGRTLDHGNIPLVCSELIINAQALDPIWLQLAFLFFVVGYGTKMGLAPFHMWLPDAHSEAPSVVSMLLSGALLNCAAIPIIRCYQILLNSGVEAAVFSSQILVFFGILSMLFAAMFIVRQPDYKRILAYSSVEHMGILALGLGLGGGAIFAAFLHAINHSVAKGVLFMTAGNILKTYGTKVAPDVRGVLKVLPVTGVLWLVGFLAITGAPPFGLFVSEVMILKSAFDLGEFYIGVIYLILLFIIFVGMASVFLNMSFGDTTGIVLKGNAAKMDGSTNEARLSIFPPIALACISLLLGLWIPGPLGKLLLEVASFIGRGSL